MMYKLIEIINSCFEAGIIMFYLDNLMREKRKYENASVLLSAIAIAAVLSAIAIYIGNPTIQISVTFLLIFSVTSLIYNEKLIKTIFSAGIFIVIIFVSESVFMSLLYLLNFGTPEDLSLDSLGRVIGMIGSKIMYFWCSVYVCKILKSKIKEISLRNWAAMVCIPIFSVVILNSIFIASDVSDKSMVSYTASVIGILLLNFFAFDYFEAYNKQLKLAVMEKILEADRQNYQLIEDKYNDIRQLRHDIRNQLKAAEEVFINDKDEGINYLNHISAELAKAEGICCTGIPSVDAIVNVKLNTAKEKGIRSITKFDADKSINIDTFTLCRILANALDNAVEACERYEGEEKFIYFVFSKQDNNLFIRISNSSHYVDVNALETEKANKITHGIGLKSINEAVRRLNGFMDISYEKDIFNMDILICSAYSKE